MHIKQNFEGVLKTLNNYSDYEWTTNGSEINMKTPNGYKISLKSNWKINSDVHIRLFGGDDWTTKLRTCKFMNVVCLDSNFREMLKELIDLAKYSMPVEKKPSEIDCRLST
ncbi:hypothetical protein, partial [Bacillus sp. AFS017336]|uniref:hypothetical protein n=1 Tax=Bacillus sp. AFS017336 TaxID=2033489 RepID=UPI000BFAC8E3